MVQPVPPIFVFGQGELLAFESTAAAQRYLEPAYVRGSLREVYDSTGLRLSATVQRAKSTWLSRLLRLELERTVIAADPSQGRDLEALDAALREGLLARDLGRDWLARASHQELVTVAFDECLTG